MRSSDYGSIINRLRRIEGQVRGVSQMVETERYCLDIIHQMRAVRAALTRAENELLRAHARAYVFDLVATGEDGSLGNKIEELIDLLEKSRK